MSIILRCVHKNNLVRLKPPLISKNWTFFTNSSRRQFCSNKDSLDVNTNVTKDVILFKYDNPRFFKIINIFAASQFVFWTYLSVFSFRSMKDAPVKTSEDMAWWQRINLGENKYKNTLAVVSFVIGYGILTVCWMYTLRSVRYLILGKGGKTLTIVTYTPMGVNKMFTLGLENVSCKQPRTSAVKQLPLKVKGHRLHYILDMRGEFKNAKLFDHTAGIQRKWRTMD